MAGPRQSLRALVEGARGALKVFPLPGVVVFPGTPMPLHVFEPRYRAMTADALAGDRVMAVATLRIAADAPQDRAPLHLIAGAAVIEREEPVDELTQVVPPESGAPELAQMAARLRSPGRLADLVAAAVVSEPEARLGVMAALDVGRRLELVLSEVAGVLAALSRGKGAKA